MVKDIVHDLDNKIFYVKGKDGKHDAELKYIVENNTLDIKSVFTEPNMRGKGYARMLVKTAVRFSRQIEVSIKATCPYAQKVIEEEFEDY